jgi:Zn-dependent protease with chaperone function
VFWWIVQLFVNVGFWVFASAWFAAGVVLFLRPTQKLVLTRLLGARAPTRTELDRLHRAWSVVAQANHIPPDRFVLAVVDSEDLNAFASGGHLVVVSSWAIANLSREDLSGVLAHELSHHLGMHTVALTAGQWLSIPIVLLARIGFLFQNIAHAATDTFAQKSAGASFVGKAIAGAVTIVSWLFLSMITVSQSIGNATGKGAEFKADETVVRMGFGRELRNALRIVIAAGNGERATHWRDRLVTAHPPARTRVARIDAQLRKASRDSRR